MILVTVVPGFEHHTFMCSACHDSERRLVFSRGEPEAETDPSPVEPARPTAPAATIPEEPGATPGLFRRVLAKLRGRVCADGVSECDMTKTKRAWRKANAYVRSGQHDKAIYWLSRTEAILNGERSRWHHLDDMNCAKSTFVQAAAADLPAATRLCPRS
jgi:hypothetical protein